MKRTLLILLSLATTQLAHADNHGDAHDFQPLFDGKTLKNWNGDPKFWSVKDGVITGQTTKENPTKGNTFLIWEGGELDDFELKVDFKIESGNSGIQVRSFKIDGPDEWRIGGYQSDFDYENKWTGLVYGEKYRGLLSKPGEISTIGEDGKPKVTGSVGEKAELQKAIKKDDWNTYHIVFKGNHLTQSINGVVMAQLIDEDDDAKASGLLALQLHAGPPMKVSFRNILLKRTKLSSKKK